MKAFFLFLIFTLINFSSTLKIPPEKENDDIDLKDLISKVDMLEKELYSKVSQDFNKEKENMNEETNEYEENDFFID